MTRLTVILPVFNGMGFIHEAIESILGQTLKDLRLLVLDDGSTDGTAAFVETLSDSRVELIRRPHRGLGETLNYGLGVCETEFIARMDADDISLPNRLECQLEFMQNFPDLGMVGTQFRYFGNRGTAPFSQTLPRDYREIVRALRSGKLAVVHGSLMFRTAILKSAGGYRVKEIGEDWDMFLRMANLTQIANIGEVHYLWRLHETNLDFASLKQNRMIIDWACDCESRRLNGEPERSFQRYLEELKLLPLWKRAAQAIDFFGLYRYRMAMTDLSNGPALRGYLNMILASICAPRRFLARFKNIIR